MKNDFQFGVNTLVGCKYEILKQLQEKYTIDPAYKRRFSWSKRIAWILDKASILDERTFKKNTDHNLKYPPVFIIGPWRSGTTLLHHYLTQVYPSSFATTYQSVFSNNLFMFQGFIKWFMQVFLPSNRPEDHIKMNANNPQEDELALGNSVMGSFYYWFYFPGEARDIAREYLILKNEKDPAYKTFKDFYPKFIKRCISNTKGEVFISKNPPNAGRIKLILELYPEARFIYTQRNPYEAIQSSIIFFKTVVEGMQCQTYDEEEFKQFFIDTFKTLNKEYRENKHLIPEGQRIEIKYEDLIADPENILEQIATGLKLGIEPDLEKGKIMIHGASQYPRRSYNFNSNYIQWINFHLKNFIRDQEYDLLH